jgi:hypothetical protein
LGFTRGSCIAHSVLLAKQWELALTIGDGAGDGLINPALLVGVRRAYEAP